jgi:flavin-dependent dehydrogenase
VRYDIGIVGGGPAGLGVALAARLRGLSVALLDRGAPAIDKACGEGLMPDGVARLARWGVVPSPQESAPFRGIRFLDGDLVAEGRFPGASGLAVRRTHLHGALAERAAGLGADLSWDRRARGIAWSDGRAVGLETADGRVECRFVVGADGLHSAVRRELGLEAPSRGRRRFGVRRHFARTPWSDCVEVYWAERCEAYVTGSGGDRVGVALLWSGEKADFDQLLERFPPLVARLGGATPCSRDRGAGPLRQRVRGVVRANVALVGDAAGYVDAITGEGLAIAFHEAEALVDAVVAGDLRLYARRQKRLRRLPNLMTEMLLVAERSPRRRRRFLRTVVRHPQLFHRLLGIHSRQLPPRSVGALGAWRLATCLLS